ncbi:MAG: hypothetical protein IAI48_15975, partial [Candidatus Eremiobacteraeota bacterium]|nr:hypothetical protein [Candidatus Eremiobacteraeota bacterium]
MRSRLRLALFVSLAVAGAAGVAFGAAPATRDGGVIVVPIQGTVDDG